MGSGIWSTDVYSDRVKSKLSSGIPTFDWSDRVHSSGDLVAHPTLEPKGVKVRESRDSSEHENSTPIAVVFDVTGSMLDIPVTLQKKLPELLGLLLRKGYVPDPQILFGAIGDATCDAVPLQMGQFESDNRMDDCLENLVLEGGGGGQKTESYELAMYFISRKTECDAFIKRDKKGYLFLIGDEMAYPMVKRREVSKVIGDGLEKDIPLGDMVDELTSGWETYFLLPKAASHGSDREVISFWKNLFGQNLLLVDDVSNITETIAMTIGLAEGTVGLKEATNDLIAVGLNPASADKIAKSLATLSSAPAALASVSGTIDLGGS